MCELSVVMPVYNAQDFLDEKLRLICELLPEKIELVVINDGSSDKSLQICHDRLDGRPNTLVVSQCNQGLSCARNRGIMEANGEYIMFLDCDDELVFDSLEPLLNTLENHKPDVLMGKYYINSHSMIYLPQRYSFPIKTSNTLEYIYCKIPDSIWNAWRYICNKSFLVQHNLWFTPNILCEDVDWTPRVLDKARCIHFFDQPFYIYFYRADSIVNTVSFKKTIDLNKTIQNNFTIYQDKPYCLGLYKHLLRESFYSLSDYYRFTREQRLILRGVVRSIVGYYHQYGSTLAKLFSHTQAVLSMFIWSCALDVAKKVRRIIRRFILSFRYDSMS